MYAITAKVIKSELTRKWTWADNWADLPVFTVDAAGKAEALQLARQIIDPLQITSTNITADEVPRAAWRAAMESELQDAARALRGDTGRVMESLRALAETVAAYTGQDWDRLMKGEEDES
jgi:hypothetical protein